MIAPVLFGLLTTFAIGRRVAYSVPDEIEPARKYLELAPDAILLVIAGLVLLQGQHVWLLLFIPAWIGVRLLLRERLKMLYAPLSGLLLALSGAQIATVAILCIAMNYILGALAQDMRHAILHGLGQPIAAALALALL